MADDMFYNRLRQRISGYTGRYSEYVLLIPDLFVLLTRLMLDPRVESRHKVYLGIALAYVVSPLDLLPEKIVGKLGYLDDVAVLVAVLNLLLQELDEQVVLRHWAGSADLLATVRRFLRQADQIIGRERLARILEYLGLRPARPTPEAHL